MTFLLCRTNLRAAIAIAYPGTNLFQQRHVENSMAEESSTVIYAALAGNLAIAVSKWVAAVFTGSSAMLSEAVHSTVDTGNELLLLLGKRRAARPPDQDHPFGHGLQLYFWSFIVALLIFGLGAGVSLVQGIEHIRAPEPVKDVAVSYIVLAISFVFEGTSWAIALKTLRKSAAGRSLWQALRRSKDPTTFCVLLEDSAALLGIVVAASGIFLAQRLRMPVFDGAASVAIGLILATVAAILANECQSLLTGEGARREVQEDLEKIARNDPGVLHFSELLTMHFGPQDVLVTLSLDFKDALGSADVEAAVSRIERQMKLAHPEIKRVFIEAQAFQPSSLSAPRSAAI